MLIADLIKNYAQKKTQNVEHYPVSFTDSESHAEQNGNLERHEVSKIEDRVQCRRCLRYQRPGETFCGCGRMLQGITDEVKKQAEQRSSSRYIMYVPGIHDIALKNTQRSRRNGKSEESQKLQRAKDHLGFRAQAQLRNDRGALPH